MRVEAGGGFVEKHDRGSADQRSRKVDRLLLPAGQPTVRGGRIVADGEPVDQRLDVQRMCVKSLQVTQQLAGTGVTIVLTTHAMDEAEALADSIYILDRGRVTVSGTVAELTSSGQNLESVYLAHTQAPVST